MFATFLWHDYETFGVNPRRDRPAQFAAVRTDVNLNQIGEPITLFCHPPKDMFPDPQACLLTGITPQMAQEKGVNEATFSSRIYQLLSAAGTCGVGYNSLRFDDEVTRFLFYRNLIDPYGREWQNGCSRWDLIDVVRTLYALRPEGMIWPTAETGFPSFKLSQLAAANAIFHSQAHDALSDVYATLALARKIRQLQPRLFDFCLALRKKEYIKQIINLVNPQPIIHISGLYPAQQGHLAIVTPLMVHPTHPNEIIVYDLSFNPDGILNSENSLIESAQSISGSPLKRVHINKSPILINNLKTLLPHNIQRWKIDLDCCKHHHVKLLAQRTRITSLLNEMYTLPPVIPCDVDEQLYSGLIKDMDRKKLDQLRLLNPEQLSKTHFNFNDARLAELVVRYRARNWLETLNSTEKQYWENLRFKRLYHGIEGYLNREKYLMQIDQLATTHSSEGAAQIDWKRQEGILKQLRAWGSSLI